MTPQMVNYMFYFFSKKIINESLHCSHVSVNSLCDQQQYFKLSFVLNALLSAHSLLVLMLESNFLFLF